MPSPRKTHHWFLIFAWVVYGTSFGMRAINGWIGLELFVAGLFYCWLPIPPLLAWWANPCFWVGTALVLKDRRIGARRAGIFSVGLGLLALTMGLERLPISYYVWLTSHVLLLLSALHETIDPVQYELVDDHSEILGHFRATDHGTGTENYRRTGYSAKPNWLEDTQLRTDRKYE